MSSVDADRERWDQRYAAWDGARQPLVPSAFADVGDLLPRVGRAIDVACGAGEAAVWLAQRGMKVQGFDVSPVAIGQATQLASAADVTARCRFGVASIDAGLADVDDAGDGPFDLVLCHLFRSPDHYAALADLVAPGGVLAVAVLSEVGASAGRFRAAPGELATAFEALTVTTMSEEDGVARWIGRRSR